MLEYGQRTVTLQGAAAERFVPALLPLLDGTRTIDEIVEYLGEPARTAVERVLARLGARGLLREGRRSSAVRPIRETAEMIDSLAPAVREAQEIERVLASRTIAVLGSTPLALELIRLLQLSGVAVVRAADAPADLTIVAASDLEQLRGCNERSLASGQPWLQVLPFDGRLATIGPLYLPCETACYECFRLRRSANLDLGLPLAAIEEVECAAPAAPVVDVAAAALAAFVALRWLAHRDHFTPGAFYAVELAGAVPSMTQHFVHRVPRCGSCSHVARLSSPLPWHKEVRVEHG